MKAGNAVQAGRQMAAALHAALGTYASGCTFPEASKDESSTDTGSGHGQIVAAVCAEFRKATGLPCELRSHAGDYLEAA